jgi:ribonuclease P protein component
MSGGNPPFLLLFHKIENMNNFKKEERLSRKKQIEKLFKEGNSFTCYPFRINYFTEKLQNQLPAKLLIVVSKKRFKNAVTRNLLKRKIRERYRLNKEAFYEMLYKKRFEIVFSLSYYGDEVISSTEIEIKLKMILIRLAGFLV